MAELSASPTTVSEPAACCSPAAQDSCCEPGDKAECCASDHPDGCGCAAGRSATTDTPR